MTFSAIFDMDGVLVDSGEAHARAWHRIGEEVGVPFTSSLFEQTFGMHNNQVVPMWLGHPVPQDEIDRLAARKEVFYRELAPVLLRPIDGVVDLLRALHDQGIRLAVGSSGPRPNVELAIGQLGVAALFSALSTGDDVTRGKPDPQVFLVAAERLGCVPARCVVFEDTPHGIEAARRGGMRAVGITSSHARADLTAADLVVDTFAGLTPSSISALFPA